MSNPLKPSSGLLCKLGSVLVHTQEMLSPKGHDFDVAALNSVLDDPEVKEWLAAMGKLALLPVRR